MGTIYNIEMVYLSCYSAANLSLVLTAQESENNKMSSYLNNLDLHLDLHVTALLVLSFDFVVCACFCNSVSHKKQCIKTG